VASFSKHIADKYKVVKLQPGAYQWRGISFDLRHISLKQADRLYAMDCPYFKLKPKKKVKDSE